jgi:hypothetical protein
MKTSRLNRVAWFCLALILTAGVTVSGNNPDGKGRNGAAEQQTCINSISGLSEYQKERITAMEAQNHKAMNELLKKQHSAGGKTQKEEIKKQIYKQTETHRNAVTSVLSADQQTQFLQFQANGANPKNQIQKQGMGKGNGHGKGSGNGSGNGRGNGNKCRM